MTKKLADDPEGRAAAKALYQRTRAARERAGKGAEIVDIQETVPGPTDETTKAEKRPANAVKDEGKAAGADQTQPGRPAGRSLRAIGARVRQNRHRFT